MMNEEQFEASAAELVRVTERMHRADGWRHGVPEESRRQRIKRLRRWNDLPVHYPDRFSKKDDDEVKGFKVVSYRKINGVELMVAKTTVKRPVIPSMDELQTIVSLGLPLPELEWKTIDQFNGYCRFKRKPVHERGYDGILSYVPVHGGITYCEHDHGVSVYGFDTAHAGDDNNKSVRNIEWVEHQAWLMARSIQIAALFEPDYLRFKNNDIRSEIIAKMHAMIDRKVGAKFKITNNFGAMINLISGTI